MIGLKSINSVLMLSGDDRSSELDSELEEGVEDVEEIVIGDSSCCSAVGFWGLAKKVLFRSSVPRLNADLRIL